MIVHFGVHNLPWIYFHSFQTFPWQLCLVSSNSVQNRFDIIIIGLNNINLLPEKIDFQLWLISIRRQHSQSSSYFIHKQQSIQALARQWIVATISTACWVRLNERLPIPHLAFFKLATFMCAYRMNTVLQWSNKNDSFLLIHKNWEKLCCLD